MDTNLSDPIFVCFIIKRVVHYLDGMEYHSFLLILQDVQSMEESLRKFLVEKCAIKKGEESRRIFRMSAKRALAKDPECNY